MRSKIAGAVGIAALALTCSFLSMPKAAAQDAPASPPAAQAGGTVSFRPVVDSMLCEWGLVDTSGGPKNTGDAIGFASGRPIKAPAEVIQAKPSDLLTWARKNKVDARAALAGSPQGGLAGFDMAAQRLPRAQWEEMTAAQALQAADRLRPTDETLMTAGLFELPATFLFKARDGTVGLLQIRVTGRPKQAVGFHYKLIQKHESEGGASAAQAAKVDQAQQDIFRLEAAIGWFRAQAGRNPTAEEGLAAVMKQPERTKGWKCPDIRDVLNDPWGRPYVYLAPGEHNRDGFDLFSLGPDGLQGTEDDVAAWSVPTWVGPATTRTTTSGTPTEIAKLISQLGDDSFAARDAAQKELVRIGLPAVGAIQNAATDQDAERSLRAKNALRQIEEQSWGQGEKGIQARMCPLRSAWQAGQTPKLSLEVRNRGETAWSTVGLRHSFGYRLEWDGQWYERSDLPPGYGGNDPPLDPGGQVKVEVGLDRAWVPVKGEKRSPLALTPGRHVARMHVQVGPPHDQSPQRAQAVSSPVEIEILPANAKPAAPAATGAEAAKPAEPPWGEAAEGVQARLRADKTVWNAGEVPAFKADVRNTGNRQLGLARAQQVCELELDGVEFSWAGEVAVISGVFPPGAEFDGIEISLGQFWASKKGGLPLKLTVGKHRLRVKFFVTTPPGTSHKVIASVVSNPVDFMFDATWPVLVDRVLASTVDGCWPHFYVVGLQA